MQQLPYYNSQHFFMLGKMFQLYGHGHKAAQCKDPEGKEFSGAGGSAKQACAVNGSGVKGPPKLTKAAKRIQNKLKKKAEE